MADGTQFPPRPDYRAARATRLGTAIRATPSNLTAEGLSRRLNWLRAAVLGANDGIVSVAGHHGEWPHIHRWADGPGGRRGVDGARRICVGVESASNEKSLLAQQRRELREMPAAGGGCVCSVVHGRSAVSPARYFIATSDVSASRHLRRRAAVVIGGPDDYRQAVPVVRRLPQASTVDEIPVLSSSLVTATG
jgi:hypothetical protein